MNILDYFYDKFIEFCEQKGIRSYFDAGLKINNHFLYDSSNKHFILKWLSPSIFNHLIIWNSTYCANQSWMEIDSEWSKLFDEIVYNKSWEKEGYNDRVKLYYVNSSNQSDKYTSQNSEIYWILGFRERIKNSYLYYQYSDYIMNLILNIDHLVQYEELTSDKFLKYTPAFGNLLSTFPKLYNIFFNLYDELKVNYLDFDQNSGKVSYFPIEKINSKTFDSSNVYNNPNRKLTTLGRLLHKFDYKQFISDREIEKYSNYIKGLNIKGLNIKILNSNKIKDVYLENNYSNRINQESSLHKSCMRYEHCQDFFEFYEKAGTKIAVAVDSNEKILCRALLWKINSKLYYLDRVYSISPFYEFAFISEVSNLFPIEIFKLNHQFYKLPSFEKLDKSPNYKIHRKKLINYDGKFPYLDTFNLFNKTTGELSISEEYIILNSTSGHYNCI